MLSQVQREVIVASLGGNDLAEDMVSQAVLELLTEGKAYTSFSLVWSRAKARLVDYLRRNEKMMTAMGDVIWDIPDRETIPDYPDIPDSELGDYVGWMDGTNTLSAIAVLCASRGGSRVDSISCSEARECAEYTWKRAYRGRLARAVDRRANDVFHSEPLPVSEPLQDTGNRTRVFFRHLWNSPDTVYPLERNDGNRQQARWMLDSQDFWATEIIKTISASCELDSAIRQAYWELSPPIRQLDYRPVKRVSSIPLESRRWYDNEDIYSSKPLIRTEWASYGLDVPKQAGQGKNPEPLGTERRAAWYRANYDGWRVGSGELETSNRQERQERIMQPSYPLARLDRYGYWS